MAFKFYQRYVQQNDITDPRDWNLNMQDLVEEFNGRLDRDNLDESIIQTSLIKESAFSVIENDSYGDTVADVGIPVQSIGYFANDGTNRIGRIELDLNSAALIRVWWSGFWEWNQTGSIPANLEFLAKYAKGTVRFRVTVDGLEVSRIHKSTSLRDMHCGSCVGSIAVDAGPHVIQVEAKVFRQPDNDQVLESDFKTETALWVKARDLTVWARRQ
jgi:hypothetical protein